MAVKSYRLVDDQGRVIIPSHIRKDLNLAPGVRVEFDADEDGTIRMRAVAARCEICGESVEDKHHAEIKAGAEKKRICYECSQKILRHIVKGE